MTMLMLALSTMLPNMHAFWAGWGHISQNPQLPKSLAAESYHVHRSPMRYHKELGIQNIHHDRLSKVRMFSVWFGQALASRTLSYQSRVS
jgi:hypothetical protein